MVTFTRVNQLDLCESISVDRIHQIRLRINRCVGLSSPPTPPVWAIPTPTFAACSRSRYPLACDRNLAYLTLCLEDAVKRGYFSDGNLARRLFDGVRSNHPLSSEAISPTHLTFSMARMNRSNHPLSSEAISPTGICVIAQETMSG